MSSPNDYFKTCTYCGCEFEARRIDQKYCSKRCKTRFNNHQSRDARQEQVIRERVTRPHAEVHWKNRQILVRHNEKTVPVDDLQREGFQVGFITSFRVIDGKKNVFFVHDMSFTVDQKGAYVITYRPGGI